MIIDYALRLYTDKINNGENLDISYFESQLSPEDFIEFKELIPFINIIKSTSINHKFKELFKEMNNYKIELEKDNKTVVNFRKSEDANIEEAKKILEDTYKEEFDEE